MRFGLTGDPFQAHTGKLKAMAVEVIGKAPKSPGKGKRRGGGRKGKGGEGEVKILCC